MAGIRSQNHTSRWSVANMHILFLLVFVLNTVLWAEQFPDGWPWKGVDTMAYAIESDPKALQFIKENNIKYVRIHFFKKKTMRDYNVSGNKALQLNLKWAKKINDELSLAGIRSFITIADFPISLEECTNKRDIAYWENKSCIDQIYDDVNKTVNYFKNSNILGYEFLGEPVVVKKGKAIQPENWNNIFKNIIKITRQTDKNKWLFYSPGPWGSPIRYEMVVPFKDVRIIYNAHMYYPHRYTHQNVRYNNFYNYPGWIRMKKWNKNALEESLLPLITFQKKYKKPVSISEFSAALWAEGSDKYIEDLIDIFNKYQWSWMYFNIGGDYKGWDARYDATLDKKLEKKYTFLGDKSKRFLVIKPFLQLDKNSTRLKNRKNEGKN